MTGKIMIQNIEEKDLDEIVEIGLSTKELHVQDSDVTYYYPKKILKQFIKSPNDIYLVAKIDDKIAGYRMATFNPFLKESYLIDMVVKPEYRGMGVANKLYEKTFEILNQKGCQWAWALVRQDNPRMKEIIKKKGFHQGTNFVFFYKPRPF